MTDAMQRNGVRISTVVLIVLMLSFGGAWAAPTRTFDADQIREAIASYVDSHGSWEAGTTRVEILSKLNATSIQGDHPSLEVQQRRNDVLLGDCTFVVRFLDGGTLQREESVRALVTVSLDVVASEGGLNKDMEIHTHDVRLVKKWFRKIPVGLVTNLDEVVGKRAAVTIRPRTEITRSMLKETLAVKRGKMVKIVIDKGAMQISTFGVSEEDGSRGTLIKVRNLTSRKIIYAKVIGDAMVSVEF